MKTAFVLSLATMATLAVADGVIDLFSSGDCSGTPATGSYSPPGNCNGGCVAGSWNSARAKNEDSGFVFTAYTDSSCSSGATAILPGVCISGSIGSFTYDCGS